MAKDYAYRSSRCLQEAQMAHLEEDYPGVVRRSQEALELAVKAVLRLIEAQTGRPPERAASP